jgi:hypothetical protein
MCSNEKEYKIQFESCFKSGPTVIPGDFIKERLKP